MMSSKPDDPSDLQTKRMRVRQRMDSLEDHWPRGTLTFGKAWRLSKDTAAEGPLLSFSSTVVDLIEQDPNRRLGILVREGARQGAAIANRGSHERHAVWQTMADEIWSAHPHLSKNSVARTIAQRCGGRANTIRQRIEKVVSHRVV